MVYAELHHGPLVSIAGAGLLLAIDMCKKIHPAVAGGFSFAENTNGDNQHEQHQA
jgi:hypothetical protein